MVTERRELRSASRCLEPDDFDDDAGGGSSLDARNVTFATCDRSDNQTWTLEEEGSPGAVRIVHDVTGLCLTYKVGEEELS